VGKSGRRTKPDLPKAEELVSLWDTPEQKRDFIIALLLAFAQGYYKILECVASVDIGWVDVDLNARYIWVVRSITALLQNPEVSDFPGGLDPIVESVYPYAGIHDLDWRDMIAPHAEEFLNRVQEYGSEKKAVVPDVNSPDGMALAGWTVDVKHTVKVAEKYHARAQRELKRLYARAEGMGRRKRPRRKTKKKADAKILLMSALMTHHLGDPEVPNWEPLTQTGFGKLLGWSQSKVSRTMQKLFGPDAAKTYRRLCATEAIAGFLMKLEDGSLQVDGVVQDPACKLTGDSA